MRHLILVARSLTVATTLAAVAAGPAVAAVQVVELSVEQAAPGTTVTLRVGMSVRMAGTEPGSLFLIAPGTFGDAGPETMPCADVNGAVEVGAMQWETGTFEFEGELRSGVIGEGTFTLPQLASEVYRLAESTDGGGGSVCHILTLFQVGPALPDTAMAP